MSDEQDYKDYQDYLAYQQHLAGGQSSAPSPAEPSASDKLMDTPFLKRTKELVDAQLSSQGIQQVAAAYLLPGASSKAMEGMGALGRIGINALTGGTAAVANQDPQASVGDKASTFAKGGALGGAISAVGEGASALGNKAADSLMRKAVGIKKVYPGVGNDLVDQGIIGTKGMMQRQVEQGLNDKDVELSKLITGLKDPIEHTDIANAVGKEAEQYRTSGGITPESVQPEVQRIQARAEDIARRDPVLPPEALELKRIAGREGYKNGNPLANLDSELAQTESAGYGNALSKAFAKANPDAPNAVDDVNRQFASLIKANRGLNVPQGEHKNIFTLSDLAGSAIGGATHGGPGAFLGYALAKGLNTPLGKSVMAHGAQKGGQAAEAALSTPEAQIAIQNLLQNLSQKKK